jgi:hypothetical protein
MGAECELPNIRALKTAIVAVDMQTSEWEWRRAAQPISIFVTPLRRSIHIAARKYQPFKIIF